MVLVQETGGGASLCAPLNWVTVCEFSSGSLFERRHHWDVIVRSSRLGLGWMG